MAAKLKLSPPPPFHSLLLVSYVLSVFFRLSHSFLSFFSWRLVFSLVPSSAPPRMRAFRCYCRNQTSVFSPLHKPSPWLIFFSRYKRQPWVSFFLRLSGGAIFLVCFISFANYVEQPVDTVSSSINKVCLNHIAYIHIPILTFVQSPHQVARQTCLER